MFNLSFKEYLKLEDADPKKRQPEFQDMASRVLGIDPKDRKGQVYIAADVQDGNDAWNVMPMVMGDPTTKDGKVTGNKVTAIRDLKGQRMMRHYVKQGDDWIDMGREHSPNKKAWLKAKVIDKWINQGAENGSQGGAGGGMPGGGMPGGGVPGL